MILQALHRFKDPETLPRLDCITDELPLDIQGVSVCRQAFGMVYGVARRTLYRRIDNCKAGKLFLLFTLIN